MAISSSVESGTIVSPATATVGKTDTPSALTGLSGLIGQPLSTVTLPGGWAWVDDTTVMSTAGTQTFKANYTDTTGNYENATNVDVTVEVIDKTNVSASITFADGELIYNGAGQAYETASISGITAGANPGWTYAYAPSDTDNYETLTGTIRLYRRSSGGGGGRSTSRYTVSFESNGGSKVSNQTVTRNSVMKEPTVPTKENFDFDGWYSDKELKTKYDFSAKVTKSFTLYAKWTEKDNSVNQIILTIGKKDAQVFGKAKSNDVAPKIEKNRTMLPARFVAENLGASVELVEKDQKVIITKPEIKKAETK